jgi:hypothetical protein
LTPAELGAIGHEMAARRPTVEAHQQ